MEENRFAHGAFAPDAADEPASILLTPDVEIDPQPDFATQAEEDSYWQGVADGIRNAGGAVPPRLAARAAKEGLLVEDPPRDGEVATRSADGGGSQRALPQIESPLHHPPAPSASEDGPPPRPGEDLLAFTPTQLRARHDGWTPQRQREFVEALADTGVVRAAAARVGMTEQSVNRLRRRPDAIAFDRACDAALRIGARRLLSVAYERAIEGTVKRHYFHGELKAEERIYDNRLLVALINKLPDMQAPDPKAEEVARNWEPWMQAIEQGLPAPPPPPGASEPEEPFEAKVWTDEGELLTDCPPPAGFDGYEDGAPGDRFYQRALSPEEEEYWLEEGLGEAQLEESWGMTFYDLGRETFFPWGSEPTSLSAAPAPPADPDEAAG